jgi:pimeloyl-ACP methyl ester carboxylesterase
MATTPKTIVLIHGMFMTPRSWEPFRGYYETRGYRVLTPPWPRLTGEVEDMRRDPTPMNGLGVTEIVDHYDAIIRELDEPPIVMGHSFGGLFVQMLLDRGLGAAGVGIDAAAPKGVLRLPWAQIRSFSPVLLNPANNRRTVALNFRQFQYSFANTMSDVDGMKVYQRNAIPVPGRLVFQAALANLNPRAATRVNFRNDQRAPLLLIAGTEDHTVPASVDRSTFRKYRNSKAVTDFKEFPGRSHLIVAQEGWEEVAKYALAWVQDQLGRRDVVQPIRQQAT